MTDVIERAKDWAADAQVAHTYGVGIRADLSTISMVRDLVAEIERLRNGGPWVEHVEYQRAMKRERDGECICNHGPDTEGPDEFCPWHGREYRYWIDALEDANAELGDAREANADLRDAVGQLRAEIGRVNAALDWVRAIADRLKAMDGVANWNAVLGQEILVALEVSDE